jgi:hypothetical protein
MKLYYEIIFRIFYRRPTTFFYLSEFLAPRRKKTVVGMVVALRDAEAYREKLRHTARNRDRSHSPNRQVSTTPVYTDVSLGSSPHICPPCRYDPIGGWWWFGFCVVAVLVLFSMLQSTAVRVRKILRLLETMQSQNVTQVKAL